VVIQNFNGGAGRGSRHWPKRVQEALEAYVTAGGGLVIFHAANNAFREWAAYNEMIGLGWRDKGFGSTLIVGEDQEVVRMSAGEGLGPGHGPDHEFVVEVLDPAHPICQGLPPKWLHASDQLSHGQRGPAKDVAVLTYAYSRDTGQNEVLEWVIPYGAGRIYVTMLGHIWEGHSNVAVRCVGFQTTFIRGVEWAATGDVTYPVPESFPTPGQVLLADFPAPEEVTM
jgi:type 1 glutamine amidotransferase